MPDTRPAQPFDAGAMADLLNTIIAAGGLSAMTRPVDAAYLRRWMAGAPDRSAWTVIEEGAVLGFQLIAPYPGLPPQACDIGTFVARDRRGLGLGSQLFNTTLVRARKLGYGWINAAVRADNEGGLTYYQSRGFRVYDRLHDVALDDGTTTTQILHRYDLP